MDWQPIPGYELVVGLEVHVELKTKTKAFCACKTDFGAPPNTQCCPVCAGLPGALPTLNAQAVRLAALAGLALGCRVARCTKADRKHYFYPDLPKAYQIRQLDAPLCTDGCVTIDTPQGPKRVGIVRIHLEEDAGKLIHDAQGTRIDLNRCGVPLIEIVSRPELSAPQEAVAYLRKLRSVLLYAGVSDCKMNEGSLRCDVNLSVRRPGEPLGVRTEIKNLNSFQAVQRAIAAEYRRQAQALARGEAIAQETRRFDPQRGETLPMRRKENAGDYRFFPEPDLPPITLTQAQLEAWRRELPILPDARIARYVAELGLTPYVAGQLAETKALADYFEAACQEAASAETVAKLMLSEVFRLLSGAEALPPIPPARLTQVANMLHAGALSAGAARRVIAALWERDEDPAAYVDRCGLRQQSDPALLRAYVDQALAQHPDMLAAYRQGKTKLQKALMGAAMALSGGKADPALLQQLMTEALAGGGAGPQETAGPREP